MRRFGVIVFSILSLGILLCAFMAVAKYVADSSDGTPAAGFGLLLMVIPFAVLVGIPLVFVLFCAALRSRQKTH